MTPPSTIASCLNRRWDRPSVRSCSAHVARIEQSEIRGTAFKLVGRPRVSLRSTRATNKKEAERRETRSPSSAPFPVALARLRERVSTPTGFVGLNQQSSSQPCSNPQFPGPPGEWCQAEFNVFGLVGGSQAQFNAGTTITVTNALNLAFGPPISASCPAPPKGMGTTGESNNLNLGSTCSVSVLPVSNRNQISFTESLASGTATNQITATLNGNGAGGPATGLTFDAGPPSKSLCQNPISTEGPPGTYSLPLPVLAGLTAMMCPGPTNYETFGYYAAPYLSKSCPGDTSPAVVPPTFQLDNNGDASILVGQGYPGQGC